MEDAKYRLETYHKMIIVRHPFSRLLSAYGNKIYPGGWYVQKYARIINRHFGNGTAQSRLSVAQFLELVVEEAAVFNNPHWNDYYQQCFPCDIEYDRVVKLETLEMDYKPIVTKLFGSAGNLSGLPKLNVRQDDGSPKDANAEFFELSEELVAKTMNFFRKDFELFGYNWSSGTGMHCGEHFGCGHDTFCI
jgi:hypothetical protein